jgi:hypothetical protein
MAMKVRNEDGAWIQKIQISGRTAVKTWRKDINDKNDHKPYSQTERINTKLPVGAYVLEAKSGSVNRARSVAGYRRCSRAEVIGQASPRVFLKRDDWRSGCKFKRSIVGKLLRKRQSRWRRQHQTTNADGLAQFSLRGTNDSQGLFATAANWIVRRSPTDTHTARRSE